MDKTLIADREPPLPPGATAYRQIGPFAAADIPAGFLREDRLKPGAWGLLHVVAGAIRFRWDDDRGGARRIAAGDTMLIPPGVPHHLEPEGPVTITIEFWALNAAA